MDLVSMKVSDNDDMNYAVGDNSYGYGTCLCLNAAQVEALGIMDPIKAGTAIMITARAVVRSSTESTDDVDENDGDNDITMQLQITDMAIDSGAQQKSLSDALYGTKQSTS